MDTFIHDTTYHVPICRSCKYVVFPWTVVTHLRDAHKGLGLSPAQRQEVQVNVKSWPDIILTEEDLGKIDVPSDTRPIYGLQLYLDGLACLQCKYVCRTERGIQGHCKNAHEWVNPKGKTTTTTETNTTTTETTTTATT